MPVQHISSARQFDAILRSSPIVVIDWTSDGCGPCEQIAPFFEQLSNQYSGKAAFISVNCSRNPDLKARYGISSYPQFHLRRNGREVDRVVGASHSGLERLCASIVSGGGGGGGGAGSSGRGDGGGFPGVGFPGGGFPGGGFPGGGFPGGGFPGGGFPGGGFPGGGFPGGGFPGQGTWGGPGGQNFNGFSGFGGYSNPWGPWGGF